VYPASWEIEVPGHQLKVRLTPLVSDQELMTLKSTRVTYWEGTVSIQGQFQGRPIRGKGYVEMTGYDRRFAPKI
jgi:predicted secreted hydrolase